MIKKILCITLIVALLTGCEKTDNCIQNGVQYNDGNLAKSIKFNEWVSPDGVHYWISIKGKISMMAPRYDKNGNLVIDKENE